MAQITTEMIRTLRERTGAGMLDVKRALEQADGDTDEAVRILRERGLAQAAKRAHRQALEGVVAAHIVPDGRAGALIELNCETDFVAKTPQFHETAEALARHAAVAGRDTLAGAGGGAPGGTPAPPDPRGEQTLSWVTDLLGAPLAGGAPGQDRPRSGQEAVTELGVRTGEHVRLRRYVRFDVPGAGHRLEAYIHGEGRIGVLLQVHLDPCPDPLPPELAALVHDLALQVAASRAEYVTRDQVPQAVIERESEVYRVAARHEGKPEKILDRIVAGRLEKFYQEVCLLEQPFIREASLTVKRHIAALTQPHGVALQVVRFARFERGEALAGEE